MSLSSDPRLWAIVVTYHRPAELAHMLTVVQRQTRPPDHIVVVDNGSDSAARHTAEMAEATYLDAGDNLGPAGGVALAMTYILENADHEDWVVSLDDDDPPPADHLMDSVWRYGLQRLAADPLTAGVGCHGADYDPRKGVFRRYEDAELHSHVKVSVIAGGALPMYRCATLRTVGVFDRDLFFGFEEGEYGLRINQAGLRLYVQGETALEMRRLLGVLGQSSADARTAPEKAAWRRYYSTRNSTLLAWRYAAPLAPFFVALGGAAKGTLALALRGRPWREVMLPARGAVDGLLSRDGRTLNPTRSYK